MIFAQPPSDEERVLLISYYKKGPNTLVRARAHTILMSAEKMRTPQIAAVLFYNHETVGDWVRAWNTDRLSSIFPKYTGNQNAAKLTQEQKEEIKKVLGSPPSTYGLPTTFWTLPNIKNHISSTFGVVYESAQSYYYLLQHCGFSFKLPSPFDRRRDDEYVEKRMEEIRKEIEPYLKDAHWEIFSQDECRGDWEEETRRAWLKRGEKTVIKLERNKQSSQSYFGALNQKTGQHHLYELDWQNTEQIVKALKKLIKTYPNKKLCIIWDNARWHKSKELREQLKKGQPLQNLHLISLPPYAPDENPEEHVWKEGKEAIANEHFDTFQELKNVFRKAVTNRVFHYRI